MRGKRDTIAPTMMPSPAGVSGSDMARSVDPWMAGAVVLLLSLGTVLVYSASARQFTDVWVAGRRLLHDGAVTAPGLESAVERAREWQARIGATSAGPSEQQHISS